MLLIFIRSTITFLLLLVVMRLMGKRQIGEMQPFELVITLVVSEVACLPLTDVSIPLIYGFITIISLLAMHKILALIIRKSQVIRKIVSGRPTIVITPEGIDFNQLRSLDMSISDLLEAMRNAGYFNFDDIEYGIFETNGTFSVLENKNETISEYKSLPIVIIEGGKFIKSSLQLLEIDDDYITKHLGDIKNVQVATLSKHGVLFIQERGKQSQTIKLEF